MKRKLETIATASNGSNNKNGVTNGRPAVTLDSLTPEELAILKNIRAREMLRMEDRLHIDNFSKDSIDGFIPHLETGNLGLVRPVA